MPENNRDSERYSRSVNPICPSDFMVLCVTRSGYDSMSVSCRLMYALYSCCFILSFVLMCAVVRRLLKIESRRQLGLLRAALPSAGPSRFTIALGGALRHEKRIAVAPPRECPTKTGFEVSICRKRGWGSLRCFEGPFECRQGCF